MSNTREPTARLRCPKCGVLWFLWSNADGSQHLNLRGAASCAFCEPAGADQLVPEGCSFDPKGRLCECAAAGMSPEERSACVYMQDLAQTIGSHGIVKPGWYCSLPVGHDGPCAAWPVSHQTQPPEPRVCGVPARVVVQLVLSMLFVGLVVGWLVAKGGV